LLAEACDFRKIARHFSLWSPAAAPFDAAAVLARQFEFERNNGQKTKIKRKTLLEITAQLSTDGGGARTRMAGAGAAE